MPPRHPASGHPRSCAGSRRPAAPRPAGPAPAPRSLAARVRDVHVVRHRSVGQAVVREGAAGRVLPAQQLAGETVREVVLADLVRLRRTKPQTACAASTLPPGRTSTEPGSTRTRPTDRRARRRDACAREQPVGSAPPRGEVAVDPLGVVRGDEIRTIVIDSRDRNVRPPT